MTGKKMRKTAVVLAAVMVIGQPAVWTGLCGSAGRAFADTAAAGTVKKDSVSASTIRLAKTEGTVEVASAGKKMSILEEMKLHSGYTVTTGEKSYAGISLDGDKAAKLDALSEAEVRKKGKKLELLINSGSLLCDVKQPLKGDETLNIRTSTMITGIRGTVLYVRVIDEFTTLLYMLEGSASVQGINPVTGETETMAITAGQCAEVTAAGGGAGVPESGEGAGNENALSPTIVLNPFAVTDIPGYVLTAVAEDPALAARLAAAGWDSQWMTEHATERLAEDEAAAAAALKLLQEAEGNSLRTYQDHVYQDSGSGFGNSSDSDGDSENGSNSGNGSSREFVTLDQVPTADQLNELLKSSDVIVDIPYDPSTEYAEVTGSSDITVPAGGRLEIGEWTILRMEAGTTLTIDGTLKTGGNLSSDGTIRNNSSNTLEVGRDLVIGGRLVNTGRIYVKESLSLENGSFASQDGQIDIDGGLYLSYFSSNTDGETGDQGGDGQSFVLGDDLTIGGGVYLYDVNCTITGGTYRGGITAVESELKMAGGTVFAGENGCGITGESKSVIRLLGGRVYGTSGGAAVNLSDSELYLAADVLRMDDDAAPFVTGTGNLTLTADGISHTYDMENLPVGILAGAETEDGWGIAVFAGGGKIPDGEIQPPAPGTATPSDAAIPPENGQRATPSSALRNQAQGGKA